MTPTNKKWIEKRLFMIKPAYTIEIGSLDVNGAIERFGAYVGYDMREGPGVDIVRNSHDLQLESETVDNIICCDMLEHDDKPWETAQEINRVLKNKGTLIVTVPGIGFKRHNFPNDYWRFTADGLKALFSFLTPIEVVEDSVEHAVRGVFQLDFQL